MIDTSEFDALEIGCFGKQGKQFRLLMKDVELVNYSDDGFENGSDLRTMWDQVLQGIKVYTELDELEERILIQCKDAEIYTRVLTCTCNVHIEAEMQYEPSKQGELIDLL